MLLSCGRSRTASAPRVVSRVFVSQDVGAGAGLLVVDAARDVRAFQSPISAGATPGMLVVTPNRVQTLAFSSTGNALSLVSNSSEATSATVTLPGFTESIVVSPDSLTAYIAIPTAAMVGKSPGAVEVLNLSNGSVTAQLSVPAVRYLAIANNGNRVLAFSDNSDSVTVISPADIVSGDPITVVTGFDRPVSAFFTSNDSSAFVVNCGAECGGAQASVQVIDLTTNTLGTRTSICDPNVPTACASSVALVNGATMYLAGSYLNPSGTEPCPGQTVFAATCGQLTVLDLTSMTVTSSGIIITNGDHNRIALGANGKLFIGAHTCTETTDVSGCLSIYNTQTGDVTIPPTNGNVTGIQPIAKRNVVYVVQGGELEIYDTKTDKLQDKQVDISGEAVDVKAVDF